MIAYDWMKTKTCHERMIMISRAQTARIIHICGYSILMMALFATGVLPIFGYSMRYITNITDPGRPLPMQTYYIFDTIKSPRYELTYIFQTIAMICCGMPYIGVDNFLSLLIFHISGQLDILENRLANLNNNTNYVVILKNCIMDHVRLLRAIIIIENIFNMILFVLFIYFGMVFVIQGVYMMSLLEDGFHLSVSQVMYIITIVSNIFGHMCIYCAVGEFLTAQCGRIHDAAYCNKWYTLQLKDMRKLILLMAKTNKPLYLTAGKVLPLTLTTFCSLLKTSAGYISVLLTAKNL
ncbi:odorant receptor Or2-like isoform X2 [Pseudomyrmex gracilis]|nr:odorant receptor Or2-like isoform X2 [Pseudomyrmex gracilis]